MTNNYSGSCDIWIYKFIKPAWFLELQTGAKKAHHTLPLKAWYCFGCGETRQITRGIHLDYADFEIQEENYYKSDFALAEVLLKTNPNVTTSRLVVSHVASLFDQKSNSVTFTFGLVSPHLRQY